MNLRARAYLLGMLPAMLVALILGSHVSYSRLHDLSTALGARSETLARYVAQGVEYALFTGHNEHLAEMVRWSVRSQKAAFAGVFKADGTPLTIAGRLPDDFPTPLAKGVTDTGSHLVTTLPVVLSPLELHDPFMVSQTSITPRPIAWVQIIFSLEENQAKVRNMLLTSIGITLLGLAFAIVLARGLARVGIRPLMDIIDAVRRVAGGDFRVRMPINAKGEIQTLQAGINTMGEALQFFHEDMQRRVEAATAELARQKQAAEAANLAKTRFLGAASHDLRQPMHAIGLYAAVLKPKLRGREAAYTLDKLDASVSAMEGLLDAILDISRLDAGAIRPKFQDLDIQALLDHLKEDFRLQAEAQDLKLRLHSPPAWVMSDPILLDRILRNLICNALRYTREGGVLLSARRRGQTLRLQVWDTGIGICAEDQERVFQEFVQIANPERDRSKGLGLGLAIVERLARLLGHHLSLRSVPGQGTVFSLDVPLASGATDEAMPDVPALEDITRLKGLVLLVDDDIAVRDALTSLMTIWGLTVIARSNSTTALAELESPPDLLVTDYRLADRDGLALAQALRDRWTGTEFPVIVITGDTSPENVRLLQASGYPVLHKPVRPARLRALVTRLLLNAYSVKNSRI
ncbi:MAG: response regulator [Thiobacillus sp.]|nr:response regulator [Thiobacillus sp.]